MGRAERRRAEREKAKRSATYNVTKAQLEDAVKVQIQDKIKEVKEEATADAINTAMILLLTLPLEVLMDHYWTKSYRKKIPEFTQHVLDYYEAWSNGDLDMDKLRADLWEYGGIRLQESEVES